MSRRPRRWPSPSFSRLPAAFLLIAGLLLGASLPADALPAEGDFDIHVDWPTDFTTTPPTMACAYGGTVAGGQVIAPEVRVRFHRPVDCGYAWVTSMTIHEVAGHIADDTDGTGGMSVDGWRQACGDPDPTLEGAPLMVYLNHPWPECIGGHNGSYTIQVTLQWRDLDGNNPQTLGPKSITVDVQNLLITGTTPANPAPILWDPDTMTTVPVSVTVTSAYRGAQHVRLSIFDSEQQPVHTLQQDGVVVGPGPTTITFQWDGAPDDPEGPPVVPRGVYLFRWEVWDGYLEGDRDQDKSSGLAVDETRWQGVEYNAETGLHTVLFGYRLTDTSAPRTDASAAQVRIYEPNLELLAGPVAAGVVTNSPGAPDPVWNDLTYQLSIQEPGRYCYLAAARDNDAGCDKGHRQLWALQRNKEPEHPLAVNCDFTNFPSPPPAGTTPHATTARDYQRSPGVSKTFYSAEAQTGATASQALDRLKQATLFYVFGHGGEAIPVAFRQYQQFWSHTTALWSYLVHRRDGANRLLQEFGVPADRIAVMEDQPDGAFNKVRLAVFAGCRTAYDNAIWGSPTRGAVEKGAKAAVGFSDFIYPHTQVNGETAELGAEEWLDQFWRVLCVEEGDVAAAFKSAGRLIGGGSAQRKGLNNLRVWVLKDGVAYEHSINERGKGVKIKPASSGTNP
ncbi:MAG: hypothetical protein HY321_13125 [Armatimonadetes bacterium]|nr:hypothetical protein [Armatimonadota bacterium]